MRSRARTRTGMEKRWLRPSRKKPGKEDARMYRSELVKKVAVKRER